MAFFLYFLEIWPLLLWKFGLGSYARSKIHWSLVLQSAVKWIKTSCCVESSYHRARQLVVLMTLRSTMFWFTEPRFAAPKTNGSLIWHNFQDQTSTAKVITPPKSTYKLGLNGICHIPGGFFEARSVKFRCVLYYVVRCQLILSFGHN